MPLPYAADTNVYVRAANEPSFRERFAAFIQLQGPLIVSSVVAEVLIGIPDIGRHQDVIGALSARTSLLAPQTEDWLAASAAVGRLGGEAITKSRSFWNDALLAAQCARLKVTLVTSNVKDFRRLKRDFSVEVREPFP